jgi:hypothetical protein
VNASTKRLSSLGDGTGSMDKGVKEINMSKLISEFPLSLQRPLKMCIHKAYSWRLKLYKHPARTLQKTYCFYFPNERSANADWEIVAVCFKNCTEHTDTVRTSQEIYYISTTETNRLMLFGESVPVCCENAKVFLKILILAGRYSNHCSVKIEGLDCK